MREQGRASAKPRRFWRRRAAKIAGRCLAKKGNSIKPSAPPSGLKRALKFAIYGLFGDFGGVEPPKSRNRTRKSFSGGFSGAVPFNSSVYRLTAPPQSKAGLAICAFLSVFGFDYRGEFAVTRAFRCANRGGLLRSQGDFGGVEPPKTLGENS